MGQTEVGVVISHCEGDVVCKLSNPKIPYFNAYIYLENKQDVGKVDDIFGPMTDAVRMNPASVLSAGVIVLGRG